MARFLPFASAMVTEDNYIHLDPAPFDSAYEKGVVYAIASPVDRPLPVPPQEHTVVENVEDTSVPVLHGQRQWLPFLGCVGLLGLVGLAAPNRTDSAPQPIGAVSPTVSVSGDAPVAASVVAPVSSCVAGMVVYTAGTTAPRGWEIADGRRLDGDTYPALFAVIGAQFPTERAGEFRLPDLRGQFIRGAEEAVRVGEYETAGVFAGDITIDIEDPGHDHSGGTVDVTGRNVAPTHLTHHAKPDLSSVGEVGSSKTGITATVVGSSNTDTHPANTRLLPIICTGK